METLANKQRRLSGYQRAEETKGPLSVVIADDDEDVVYALEMLVSSMGHNVIGTAPDGEEAVTLALQHKPDVVILDVDMPKRDGLSAAAEIRKELSVAILFCTAHSEDETLDRAQKVGSQAYIVKPFGGEQIKTSLRLAVSRFRSALEKEIQIEELTMKLDGQNAEAATGC
jgi:response regulator NasT